MLRALSLSAAALIVLSGSGLAPSGAFASSLETMPHGRYICALPGDAGGEAFHEVAERNFIIVNSSSYETAGGGGTYLMMSDRLTFTFGPLKGQRYIRKADTLLQSLNADDSLGEIRCARKISTSNR